jgi:putative transposase
MPPELHERVDEEVKQTRRRSGWPASRTLAALGVSRSSYYRWRREQARGQPRSHAPPRPVQVHEATEEERKDALDYARRHPELRHRELAWRMIDEDVAYLSPSTVYRILKTARLVCAWRPRSKRYRESWEKAQRCDQRWATDLLHLRIGGQVYYLIAFLDEYSRYIVHHELLMSMDGATVSLAAQAAIETLKTTKPIIEEEKQKQAPEIRSDNGGGYVSREFRVVLDEHGLAHHRIRPHCPEENGLIERANRTLREALDGEALDNLPQARQTLKRVIRWYNEERLHSALGYLRPVDCYRGDPERLHAVRRIKLAQARHRRKEANLRIRQLSLPLESEETVA